MSNTKKVFVGIDLGTTFSLASVLQGGEPMVLPNSLGELLTPSVVSVTEDGCVVVGAPAKARATTHPERTAQWFKRDMGTDRVFTLGEQKFRPEQLSALVLAEVKRGAEQALGQTIDEAVVTVPAYFGELQRRATRNACDIAGLQVERIINEPTAAALAYGLSQKDAELRAVVLDIGGGTFDVTVLEIIEGVIEIQASAGDSRLGGEDFADLLTEHTLQRMALEFGLDLERSGSNFARLRDACEFAKKQLSKSHEARIALPAVQGLSGAPQDVELTLTREQLNAVCSSLLERMERPIRRALRDAQLTASEVDAVILVGGTTRMPAVVDLAARVFGRLPLRHLPPDEAVAMGAAVQAALKAGDEAVEDMVVTDVAPFSLGIASGEQVQGQIVAGLFSPIIDRGTVLPASRVQTFHTLSNGQKQIEVEVFQGEHSLCADNQHLGSYTVNGIPPAPAGEQAVEVRFSYDLNGILEVDTIVVATKKKKSLLIDKSPGALSAAQLKRARQDLQRLKFHPREALPNVTALARAEAVVVNLVGPERNALLAAINAFRGAVETQDPEQVELFREMLVRSTRDAGEGR